ncbi:hypothetical protein TNCV_1076531 [Trichonephila clavipes]|uniref:Uncharacterized protein n=1 Tax=Trichonephila clavipes TaxID=2585209 RepID=A0A8X6RQP8_TRICX|nr:hypothetical protein TNCV_1076531 [Trichonephila clavipes]
MYSTFAAWVSLNSRLAANSLVRLAEVEERREAPLSKLGWKRATTYCRLQGDRGYGQGQDVPQCGTCQSGGISNNNNNYKFFKMFQNCVKVRTIGLHFAAKKLS